MFLTEESADIELPLGVLNNGVDDRGSRTLSAGNDTYTEDETDLEGESKNIP